MVRINSIEKDLTGQKQNKHKRSNCTWDSEEFDFKVLKEILKLCITLSLKTVHYHSSNFLLSLGNNLRNSSGHIHAMLLK